MWAGPVGTPISAWMIREVVPYSSVRVEESCSVGLAEESEV